MQSQAPPFSLPLRLSTQPLTLTFVRVTWVQDFVISLTEEEHQQLSNTTPCLKRSCGAWTASPQKDFRLIRSFPGHRRLFANISSLLLSAFFLSVPRLEVFVATQKWSHQDTLRCQSKNVSTVPSSRSCGQQYKITPPGAEPLWHLCARDPFCHRCSFTSLPC